MIHQHRFGYISGIRHWGRVCFHMDYINRIQIARRIGGTNLVGAFLSCDVEKKGRGLRVVFFLIKCSVGNQVDFQNQNFDFKVLFPTTNSNSTSMFPTSCSNSIQKFRFWLLIRIQSFISDFLFEFKALFLYCYTNPSSKLYFRCIIRIRMYLKLRFQIFVWIQRFILEPILFIDSNS